MTELDYITDLHKNSVRQGPGSENDTLKTLGFLDFPTNRKLKIADIGCGSGGQTITLAKNENETEARNYLSELQSEYKDFSLVYRIYKGKNAFGSLKDRVIHTADSFMLLQQGSRSLMDYLFRKFMINELVYNTQTPLIVLSS